MSITHDIAEQLEAAMQGTPLDYSTIIALNQKLAGEYAKESKFGKSVACLEAALEAAEQEAQQQPDNNDNPSDLDAVRQKADIYFQLALYYDRVNEGEKALHAAEKALELFQSCEAESDYPKTYRRLGAIQIELGQPDEGFNNLDIALDWAEKNGDNLLRAGIYVTLAEALNHFKSPDDSYKYYQMAAGLYENEEEWNEAAINYQSIGRLLHNYGNNKKAIEMYKKSAECYENADGFDEEKGLNYMLLARILESVSRNEEATKYYEKAVPCFIKAENHFETANCYIQSAILYQEKKQWANVLDTYQKALPYAEYSADEMLLGTIHDGIEHAKEEVQKRGNGSSNQDSDKDGFWGKMKKIFGK